MNEDTLQRIHNSFLQQSLMRTFDAEIGEINRGEVTLISPIGNNALQQQGFAHAGLTFALGDSAAGYAALTTLPEGYEVVTAEMKINLLAPAAGQRLKAIGHVVKPGRRLVVVAANVFCLKEDETETHVALLQGTMVPVPK